MSKALLTPPFSKYLLNCFILAIPILVWNIIFTDQLPAPFQPAIFWQNIPSWVMLTENISRSLLFVIMLLFPLRIATQSQKRGLSLYLTGLILYCTSWLALIYAPNSNWSQSALGFMAPAYTPLLWLLGIGMTGDRPFIPLPQLRRIYVVIACLFTLFHCGHTYLIFTRSSVHHTALSGVHTLPGRITAW